MVCYSVNLQLLETNERKRTSNVAGKKAQLLEIIDEFLIHLWVKINTKIGSVSSNIDNLVFDLKHVAYSIYFHHTIESHIYAKPCLCKANL